MFCPSCGKEIVDGATFCTHCGKQIQSSSATVTSESKKGKKFRPILLLIPAVIVIGIILFISLGSSDSLKSEDLYVGGQVYFGKYEQDNNLTNGEEKILWDVIDEDDEGFMLISHFILFNGKYDYSQEYKHEFIDSAICYELNTDFVDTAFTEKEMERILPTCPQGAYDATYVQLLAMEQIPDRFDCIVDNVPSSGEIMYKSSYLICGATDYAIACGFRTEEPWTYFNDGYVLPDEYEGRTGKWLLAYHDNSMYGVATVVEPAGVACSRTTLFDEYCGIRPVIWIKK